MHWWSIVCPDLLIQNGEGFCRRNAEDVRAYWGRAAGSLAMVCVLAWAGGSTAVWSVFRFQGFQNLAWSDVAFPMRWNQLDRHRFEHFMRLASDAMKSGDVAGAQLAFSSAALCHSATVEEQLVLARMLYSASAYAAGGAILSDLAQSHPGHRQEITRVWHDCLLQIGDNVGLARLSLLQIEDAEPAAVAPWWRAFFEAVQVPGTSVALGQAVTANETVLAVLKIQRELDSENRPAAESDLRILSNARWTVPWLHRYLVEAWIRLKNRDEALKITTHPDRPENQLEIGLMIFAIERNLLNENRAVEVLQVILGKGEISQEEWASILGMLIRYPSVPSLDLVMARLKQEDKVPRRVAADFWVASRIADWGRGTDMAADLLGKDGSTISRTLQSVNLRDARPGAGAPRGLAAALLPLDIECLYGLMGNR